MRRNFYLVIHAMRKYSNFTEPKLIELIFPESDVRDHLADKLYTCNNRTESYFIALYDFYMSLDTEHQLMFDKWANAEFDQVNKDTTPYLSDLMAPADHVDPGEVTVELMPGLTDEEMITACKGFNCTCVNNGDGTFTISTGNKFTLYNLAGELGRIFIIKKHGN
jgi:hypothetical protein